MHVSSEDGCARGKFICQPKNLIVPYNFTSPILTFCFLEYFNLRHVYKKNVVVRRSKQIANGMLNMMSTAKVDCIEKKYVFTFFL